MRRKLKIAEPVIPPSYHDRFAALGLRPMLSLPNSFNAPVMRDGEQGREWLPQLLIGADRAILFLDKGATGNGYDFAGWQPFHLHRCGGLRADLHSALAWMERSLDIEAGRAKDFLGC